MKSSLPPSSIKEEAKLWGIRVIGQNYPILDDPQRKPSIWRDAIERMLQPGEELVEILIRLPAS